MFTVGTYDLTQGVFGFVLGIFSALIVAYIFLRLVGGFFFRRNQNYYHRRGHHQPYPQEPVENGMGCFPILVLLIVAGLLFSRIEKAVGDTFNKDAKVTKTEKKSSGAMHSTNDLSAVPDASASIGSADAAASDSERASENQAISVENKYSGSNYYIQAGCFERKNLVKALCENLIQRGLTVSTMPKGSCTAVFIGSYASREKAEAAKQKYGFEGPIEAY